MYKASNDVSFKRKLMATIGPTVGFYPYLIGAGIAGLLLTSAPEKAQALNLYDGAQMGNELEINLDTTLSYTGEYRVNDPSAVLTSPNNLSSANGNDGDSNFRHGIVGNLFEAVPVLDILDGDYGAHFSGEFYLNTPYLGTNQNNQASTVNSFNIAKHTDFTPETRAANGLNAELLDAFAYGQHHFGADQTVSLKVGRQTLLWGQSLFFLPNGIAAGQAPFDAITAQNEVDPETQQEILPVGQAVLTYSPNSVFTIQGYYQFEWRPDNYEGVGSYFDSTDILGPGGQRIIAATLPGENFYLFRLKDLDPPSENGQFGLSVQATLGRYDVGLYALRYDSKTPTVYEAGNPPGTPVEIPTENGISVGSYQVVYPRDIQIFGASASTTILGDDGPQVAGEISGRRNMPLASGALISTVANPGNANSNPLYPVGDTWAAQASATYLSAGIPLDPGGVEFAGEIAFNHLIDVTKNRAALAVGYQASAAAINFVITPTYYDVLPHLTLGFPISLEYNFLGRSIVVPTMYHGTGTFDFGVTGTFETNWIARLNYQDYLGSPNPVTNGLADRGFVSLNLQHTF